MTAFNAKPLPYYEPGNDADVIDFTVRQPRQIIISEKEYLELKSAVGYWQVMHKKAVLRESELKEIIKEQEGKIRDLKGRLFGKKSEKGATDTSRDNNINQHVTAAPDVDALGRGNSGKCSTSHSNGSSNFVLNSR